MAESVANQGQPCRRVAYIALLLLIGSAFCWQTGQPLAAEDGVLAIAPWIPPSLLARDADEREERLQMQADAGIWRLPVDGGAATRVLACQALVADPVLSPDRQRLAYVRIDHEAQTGDVWITGRDGDPGRRLAGMQPQEYASWLAWSPDGERLAYTVIDYSGNPIKAMRSEILTVASGERQPLFAGYHALWSPDGSRLAATWLDVAKPEAVDAIAIISDTGEVQRWCGEGSSPSWSPDGSRLAYVAADGRVVIRDPESADEGVMTAPLRAERAVWSPDGGLLAVATQVQPDPKVSSYETVIALVRTGNPKAAPRKLPKLADNCIDLRWISEESLLVTTAFLGLGYVSNYQSRVVSVVDGSVTDFATTPEYLLVDDGFYGGYHASTMVGLYHYYTGRLHAAPD